MNIHRLMGAPPPPLARALAEFERQFTYPLGIGRTFSISHGEDYGRFFRAIGAAATFVAENDGRILGTVGVAARTLLTPQGERRQVAYIGDLKITPAARGGLLLLRLFRAGYAWVRPHVTAAYGIVMDGTANAPSTYTGRIDLPLFSEVAKITVLRIAASAAVDPKSADGWLASVERGEACYERLSRGRYAGIGGDPAERSETPPLWIVNAEGTACGRLEETRRAKRLIDSDGIEMRSAHLACCAWQTAQAGAELIAAALGRAALFGFPALFVAVPQADFANLDRLLGGLERTVAPATIYAASLDGGAQWNISTSEI